MRIAFVCSNDHYVNFDELGIEDTGHCPFCHKRHINECDFQVSTPNSNRFFNHGLGCVTKGTKDAERIARRRGLIPMGSETLDTHKIDRDDERKRSSEITGILNEGMKAAKAGKTLEGKPLSKAL